MRPFGNILLIAAVAVAAAVIPALAAPSTPTTSSQLRALVKRVDALNVKVTSVNDRVTGVNNRVTGVSGRTLKLSDIVDELAARTTKGRVSAATGATNNLGVAYATASCGPGEHVTGGGGTFESPLAGDTTVMSRPYANGWRVAMKRGSSEAGKLHAYAMCESFGV